MAVTITAVDLFDGNGDPLTPTLTNGTITIQTPPTSTPTPGSPAFPPTFSGPELTELPDVGGSPADDPSSSPHRWLAAVLGGVFLLTAGGLTALRASRRRS